jgi:hypothetical protein
MDGEPGYDEKQHNSFTSVSGQHVNGEFIMWEKFVRLKNLRYVTNYDI